MKSFEKTYDIHSDADLVSNSLNNDTVDVPIRNVKLKDHIFSKFWS